jgi:MFS transporter, OFA family, oxalate/formate antiporter
VEDSANTELPSDVAVNARRHLFLENCWVQLCLGIVGMVAIANLQYGWTLFVDKIEIKFHWSQPAIQLAFTLFVLAETWLLPIEGYLVDRFGPRPLVAIGGVLVGLSWVENAFATSLLELYLAAVVGGIGAGIVYGTSIGNALKWFPRRRGLAAGLTASAFGAGSALTVYPISQIIEHQGYEAAFLWFGIGQGTIVILCSLFLRSPREEASPVGLVERTSAKGRDYTWLEMVRTPMFWLMYAMFTMVAMGGLMATAQLAPMARFYHVANSPVTLFGRTAEALALALSLQRVLNGVSRPFFGWVSDQIGRELTIFLAFGLEGISIILLIYCVEFPVMFVILTGLTFFAWGEIYSLFPALCGDAFGRKFATTNYGLLYTAKGTASLLIPIGSWLQEATGSWKPIFLLAVVFDLTAALLAMFVLRPMRQRQLAEQAALAALE